MGTRLDLIPGLPQHDSSSVHLADLDVPQVALELPVHGPCLLVDRRRFGACVRMLTARPQLERQCAQLFVGQLFSQGMY